MIHWRQALAASMIAVFSLASLAAFAGSVSLSEVEQAAREGHWNEAVQLAHDLGKQNPSPAGRVQGAYALFQKNYSSSALLMLSRMRPADWAQIPQGQDRMAEVMALLQKKVPLNIVPLRLDQIRLEQASPYLIDEVRYAKGREAFEAHQTEAAEQLLRAVPQRSRFFAQAHYLLGTLAVERGDRSLAAEEYAKIFVPAVYEQASELWHDISAQTTSHWGTNLQIKLDADLVKETAKVGELALLAMARLEYANSHFKEALAQYQKFSGQNAYYPRASLEKVWTLLQLNQHEAAEQAAAQLAVADQSFEAIEARLLRALILADAGRSDESRQQLDNFTVTYKSAKASLSDFDSTQDAVNLPAFLRRDLDQDRRLTQLKVYSQSLQGEMQAMAAEDHQIFPVYLELSLALRPLLDQATILSRQITAEHVRQRRQDLDKLLLQARLVRVETYLEDREKLRLEFRQSKDLSAAHQNQHDRRLVQLLNQAVDGVDEILSTSTNPDMRLKLRQSELLWELAKAYDILTQTQDHDDHALSERLKMRSWEMAHAIAQQPQPPNESHAQALFFTGFALSDTGRPDEAVPYLQRYTQLYPQYPHAADAYRIMADTRFDENKFRAAEDLYNKIMAYSESPIVGYALYKIGWCAYNLKDFARTLLGLEKAYVWANRGGQNYHLLSLQREAQHDLIKMYAEFGDHHKAREYFGQFLEADPKPWLIELAQELDHMGQFEKSGDLYKLLIGMDPGAPENVSYQAAMIDGFQQLHRWPQALEAAEQLQARDAMQLSHPQAPDSPAGLAEKIVREAALAQEFEYRKQRSAEAAGRVNRLDEIYLALFGAWPQAQQPLYTHAYFVLSQKRDKEAAALFLQHWERFSANLKEPLREEALRNLISALNQVEITETATPTGFSETAAYILTYSQAYEKSYANNPHFRAIAYLRPAILFKYGQTAEALVLTQKMFDQNPSDDIGQRCFKNLRATYYADKNWQQTYLWATDLEASTNKAMARYSLDLKTIREESFFLWANDMKDDAQAAAQFDHMAHDGSMPRLREKSLYNAFVRYHKAGQNLKALTVAGELEKTAPRDKGLAAIAGPRAALYQEAGDYRHALPLLENFLQAPDPAADGAVVSQAHLNAGLIAEALGQDQNARQHLSRVMPRTPASAATPEAELAPIGHPKAASAKWLALQKSAKNFAHRPLSTQADMAQRIRRGTTALEKVSQELFAFSADPAAPTDEAFEAYCQVPLLYEALHQGIAKIGQDKMIPDGERDDLQKELLQLTKPLADKTKELAATCISKSQDAEHYGPIYHQVLAELGPADDESLKKRAEELRAVLAAGAPWLDSAAPIGTEEEILARQLDKGGDAESWYALARQRWDPQHPKLARLTALDALSKFPNSGKLWNVLAVIAGSNKIGPLLTKAVYQGSIAASANLVLYHLQGERLKAAQAALTLALARGGLPTPRLVELAKEMVVHE